VVGYVFYFNQRDGKVAKNLRLCLTHLKLLGELDLAMIKPLIMQYIYDVLLDHVHLESGF
jgi:hypothetical protein